MNYSNTFCGRKVSWLDMTPLTPGQLEELGSVEYLPEGEFEHISHLWFHSMLSKHEKENAAILRSALETD